MNIENDLNGLKYFVKKKIEKEILGSRTGFIVKLKSLKRLKQEKPEKKNKINLFFAALGVTLTVPFINLMVALSTHSGLLHLLKEVSVFGVAMLVAYIGVMAFNGSLREDIKESMVESSLPNIKLNEGDMLEIGMYLSNEEKDQIATRIYKDEPINLITINEIIEMKEKLAMEEQKKRLVGYLRQSV